MPTIHRLGSDDPKHGGVLVTFDDEDRTAKVGSWTSSTHVNVEQTARRVVEGIIESARDRPDLLNSTNWVSLVAGVCKHITDWNDALVRSVSAGLAERLH